MTTQPISNPTPQPSAPRRLRRALYILIGAALLLVADMLVLRSAITSANWFGPRAVPAHTLIINTTRGLPPAQTIFPWNPATGTLLDETQISADEFTKALAPDAGGSYLTLSTDRLRAGPVAPWLDRKRAWLVITDPQGGLAAADPAAREAVITHLAATNRQESAAVLRAGGIVSASIIPGVVHDIALLLALAAALVLLLWTLIFGGNTKASP